MLTGIGNIQSVKVIISIHFQIYNRLGMQSRRVWIGFLLGILLLVIIVFGGSYFPISTIDHAVYWSAARINLEGGNPYDTSTMVAKQVEIGLKVEAQEAELMMYWYPPWSLAVVMPIGFLSHQTSQVVWYLCSIGIVLFAAGRLWILYGGRPQNVWLAWILISLFSPFWSVLYLGQISPFMLFGIVSFLVLLPEDSSNPRRDFLAGMGASLASIKPVMVYLFWSAVALWLLSSRRWYVAAGIALAVLGGIAIGMSTNPQLPQQFLVFVEHQQATQWAVPTIGSWLRSSIAPDKVWLQFTPMIIGAVWIFLYWFHKRSNWIWKDHLPVILCVSLITTPFAWTHDQIMLLPAIISAAIKVTQLQRPVAVTVSAFWLAFNFLVFILHLSRGDQFFFWQAPLILIFYVIINRIRITSPQSNTA